MCFETELAVVTGGGQGVGEGHTEALAADGAKVVIAELAEAQGERVAKASPAVDGGRIVRA